MRLCATEFFEGDFFARHGLHNIGAGNEHVRGFIDHEDEVSHGGAVHRATGAWAKDHGDLRGHTRRLNVAMENAAVTGERHNAFLNTSTCAVVQTDERRTNRKREIHHLVDLLGEDFAKSTTKHGEVLREHEDLATIDGSPTRHNTVGVRALFDATFMGTVTSEHVEFVERTLVEEVVNALSGKHFALQVLAFNRTL